MYHIKDKNISFIVYTDFNRTKKMLFNSSKYADKAVLFFYMNSMKDKK